MGYFSRAATERDFGWCANILDDGFEQHPGLKRELPRLWRRLYRDEAMSMIVIVDDRSNEPVAFGAGGILSDDAIASIRTGERPHVAVRVMEAEAAGRPCILRPDDVRRVNHPSHRVNLAVLHYSEFIPDRSFEQQRVIRDKAVSELLNAQRGYATKEFVFEFYGADDVPFSRAMGTNLRSDYRGFYGSGHAVLPPPEKRPYLVGLTLDEVARSWGSPVGMLFGYLEPVIFFTPMQQRVLVRACRTPTPGDADLSDELTIERSTLRDHWRAIFARVAAAQADDLLPRGTLPDFAEPSPALRPALLAYLHQHPEELRPVDRKHFGERRFR
jgi:hypothetical protein